LFALGSDTVVDTQTATEKTNDKNRYRVNFVDVPSGTYRLNAFVGATGGFANEIYDLTFTTATFYPRKEIGLSDITSNVLGQLYGDITDGNFVWDGIFWSRINFQVETIYKLGTMLEQAGPVLYRFTTNALEQAPATSASAIRSAVGLASANLDTQLGTIQSKTNLITAGTVSYSGPVDPTGKINSPIIRGDDYLAANNRAFTWTFAAITGLSAATCTSKLGFKSGATTLVVTGTVTDNGNGTWTASHDVTRVQSATLTQQQYDWSVEIVHSGGTEITPVRSGRGVTVAEKYS
jgi:hypothetical protein